MTGLGSGLREELFPALRPRSRSIKIIDGTASQQRGDEMRTATFSVFRYVSRAEQRRLANDFRGNDGTMAGK